MAEIHIEKRQRSTWPWVLLGLVLLALLLWWLLTDNAQRIAATDTTRGYYDTAAGTIARPSPVAPSPAAGAAFFAFNDSLRSRGDEGVTRTTTATGIRRLSSALGAITGAGSMRMRIDSLGELADSLEQLPASESGRITHDAFTRAASIMTQVQRASYPDARDEVNEVLDAAGDVESDEPISEQRDDVREFFDETAKALHAMTKAGM